MKIFLLNKKILLIIFFISLLFLFLFTSFSFFYTSAEATSEKNVLNKFSSNMNQILDGKEKICYLTFDDGPNPLVTPKVLDILKEEGVKATFFVIGKSVDNHPEIVKRAYEEGHYIANHSYSHNNAILYQNFEEEIKKTDLAIGNAIGISNYCSHVFRFPNRLYGTYLQTRKEKSRIAAF